MSFHIYVHQLLVNLSPPQIFNCPSGNLWNHSCPTQLLPLPKIDSSARVVVSKGCYYLSQDNVKLDSLEGSTPDLSDNPRNRMNAIVKCQEAAQQFGFNIFAVSLGYCISGSNWLSDYQLNPASDDRCHSGLGGRATGYITMNVYQITAARPHLNPPQSLHLTNRTGPALSHDSVADTETMQTSSNANLLLTPSTLLLLLAFCCLWL